jgi:hypothetical protein
LVLRVLLLVFGDACHELAQVGGADRWSAAWLAVHPRSGHTLAGHGIDARPQRPAIQEVPDFRAQALAGQRADIPGMYLR